MKKKWLIFNCITIMLFCQVAPGVGAISGEQKQAISNNCDLIKESLKTTQRMDSRARVYLGGKFETILSKYITPLNLKLVEKYISDADLFENRAKFAEQKEVFASDFVKYQQALEDLIKVDCKNEPTNFYDKLLVVRGYRKTVGQDVVKLKKLASENVELVTRFRSSL